MLNNPPLITDLDGTILLTDSLYEGLAAVLAKNPGSLFKLPFIRSRLALKHLVASYAAANASCFPFNEQVIHYLQECRGKGRQLYLATASPLEVADICAQNMGCFKEVFASTQSINLKGKAKAELLCSRFGKGNFDYIGDSLADVPVWACAHKAIVASGNNSVIRAAKAVNDNVVILPVKKPSLKDYARAMRLRQWVKNLLVFLPMLLAHSFTAVIFLKCLLAFFSLSLCASSIYVVNDVFDLESDRRHPRKKARPFASGAVPLAHAPAMFAACLSLALFSACFLPPVFLLALLVYLGCTISYTAYFKKRLFLDVVILAGLYVLRIVAGAAAIGYFLSNWLLGFAGFFFLGLALFKRAGATNMHGEDARIPGRAYMGGDQAIIEMMGVCSCFCSVVIVALYIDSLQALRLYANPAWLWLVCPLLLYWCGRLALLTRRGEVSDDPVNFAVTDRVSWLILAILGLTLLLAL